VLTIEGLESADGTLHPVQQAVVDLQGFQCAFCMSGFVMNMVALTEENPDATRSDAAHHLAGNLCRCIDYNKILNVAEKACEYTRNGMRS
jgi:xanthine dehydrogenase iron-sulfur cluster and FAD-binding subunit A